MKVPCAKLPKKVKGLLKGSKKGHRIRITPFATSQHYAIGTINPELTAITVDEISMAYVCVQREQLEFAFPVHENYSAILVERHVSESAKRALDENLANNSKGVRQWKKALKKHEPFIILPRVRKNKSETSKREKELHEQVLRLERQINSSMGTVIEMMIAGIIPMHRPAPFPMKQVTQMRYGCDYLSYQWKGNALHLHWVEVNLDQSGNYPTLTRNEKRFKKAIESGNVVNHYHHTWVDCEGEQRWDSID
jgi:hypothetical protein